MTAGDRRLGVALLGLLVVAAGLISIASAAERNSPGLPLASADDDGFDQTTTGNIAERLSVAELESFDTFEIYWLGETFDELPLTSVDRVVTPRQESERGMNLVDIVYGECDATRGSCAYPMNVQVWPACERNRSSLMLAPDQPYPYEPLTVRGVPAGLYDEGTRLEIYTGAVTVVIFAELPELVMKAADELRPVGGTAVDILPPPVAGALDGRLACEPDVAH